MAGHWQLIMNEKYNLPYYKAISFARLGQVDSTLACIDELYVNGSSFILMCANEPVFDVLHQDPRFIRYMKGVGLDKLPDW